jgi:hypothetical protein
MFGFCLVSDCIAAFTLLVDALTYELRLGLYEHC